MSAYERKSLVVSRVANSIAERANEIAGDQRDYAFWQLVIAAFVMGFTGLAAYAAWRAAKWARAAAEHTQSAAREGKRSADAAHDQLDAVKTAERAYLILHVAAFQDPEGKLIIQGMNFGRTFAHISEMKFVSRTKLPPSPALKMRLQTQEADLDMGTSQQNVVGNTTALGPKINHVLGYIRYQDVYRRSHRAYFRYDRVGLAWRTGGGARWNRAVSE